MHILLTDGNPPTTTPFFLIPFHPGRATRKLATLLRSHLEDRIDTIPPARSQWRIPGRGRNREWEDTNRRRFEVLGNIEWNAEQN